MKNKFTHSKKSQEVWDDADDFEYEWDEADFSEGSDYADDSEYSDAEGYEDSEYAENGEYYGDEEYLVTDLDDGYFEGDDYNGEYAGDYSEEPADGYSDPYGEEGGHYNEDGEFVVDDDMLGEEIIYIDDEFEPDFEEPKPRERRRAAAPVEDDSNIMDIIIMVSGVAVLLLLLCAGGIFLSKKNQTKQVASLNTVGTQLDGIDLIGEKGIDAVADAKVAKLQAAADLEIPIDIPEDPEDPGYNENDYNRQVTVDLNMTSIQKDLKIKFTNQKTGKLVPNVPFSVTVKDPSGKEMIWSDDDMDGIIYKKDIADGTYTITMEELTDSKYSGYTISTVARKAEVKKTIAYQKVDVANEVKSESEIDSKKEDTKKNETTVEGSLTDTVAWVESKVVTSVYSEIPKNKITDPLELLDKKTASVSGTFMRMTVNASGAVTPGDKSLAVGETVTLKAEAKPAVTEGEVIKNTELQDIVWSSSDAEIAAVDASGVVTAKKEGKVVITFSATAVVTAETPEATPTPTPEATPTPTPEATPTPTPEATPTPTPEATPTPAPEAGGDTSAALPTRVAGATEYKIPVTGKCEITVTNNTKISYKLDKETVTLSVKAADATTAPSATVKAIELPEALKDKVKFSYTVDKADLIDVAMDANNGIFIISSKSTAGTAVVTITANYKENASAETAVTTKLTVTVGLGYKMTFTEKELKVYAEETPKKPFSVVVENVGEKLPEFKFISSNEAVLTATAGTPTVTNGTAVVPVILKPLAEGNVTLTVSTKQNDAEVKETCTIVVKPNPKKDTKTELLNSEGENIYVKENNEYRKATYADYYTYSQFFVKAGQKYTGWQTIDGKVYFFNAEGKAVTGEQIIQGAKYTFNSEGVLVVGNGALGIDVSKWNGTINWTAVKNSGVNYVIIRCGYRGSSKGALVEDPKFEANIKGATSAGLKVGVYFFTQAIDEREAVEEASMVLGQIKNYKISYPIFLDVEPSGGRADSINKDTRTAVCKAFCQTIQNAGYTSGIYANKSWLETKLDPSALSAYKIWLAQYATTPTYQGRYDLWQYRSTGKVSGISGDVDLNLSFLGY